jgi:hypothetical protein
MRPVARIENAQIVRLVRYKPRAYLPHVALAAPALAPYGGYPLTCRTCPIGTLTLRDARSKEKVFADWLGIEIGMCTGLCLASTSLRKAFSDWCVGTTSDIPGRIRYY